MLTLKLVSHAAGEDGKPKSQAWIPGVTFVSRIGSAYSSNAAQKFAQYGPIDHDYINHEAMASPEVFETSTQVGNLCPGNVIRKPDSLICWNVTEVTRANEMLSDNARKKSIGIPYLRQGDRDNALFEPDVMTKEEDERVILHLESLTGEVGEIWSAPLLQIVTVISESGGARIEADEPVSLLCVTWGDKGSGSERMSYMLVERAYLIGPDGGTVDRIAD